MRHNLKIWPLNLAPILAGKKTCEIRVNDRNYQVGDTLCLRPFDPDKQEYINDMIFEREVTYINLIPGSKLVALSIKSADEPAAEREKEK